MIITTRIWIGAYAQSSVKNTHDFRHAPFSFLELSQMIRLLYQHHAITNHLCSMKALTNLILALLALLLIACDEKSSGEEKADVIPTGISIVSDTSAFVYTEGFRYVPAGTTGALLDINDATWHHGEAPAHLDDWLTRNGFEYHRHLLEKNPESELGRVDTDSLPIYGLSKDVLVLTPRYSIPIMYFKAKLDTL